MRHVASQSWNLIWNSVWNQDQIPRFAAPLVVGFAFSFWVCCPVWADSYDIGLKLYGEGNYEMAARYFLEAAGRTDNPNIHYYLADTYLKMDRLAEAQAEYQKVLAIAPDTQAARLSRVGLAHLRETMNGTRQRTWSHGRSAGQTNVVDRYTGGGVKGEDYLDYVTEAGKIVRWSFKKMPLKVYIESSPVGIRNFQPAYANQVSKALDVWSNALGHQISFAPTTNKEQADLRVSWVNNIDTKGHSDDGGTAYTAGLTVPSINNNQLKYMDIKLATFDIEGSPQNAETIYAVAVHEFGHSLGLLGHSPDPADIMFARNEHVTTPSKRDNNTIRLLYSSQADVDNLPTETRPQDDKRQEQLNAKMDLEIQRMEAQAKQDDMALSWLNLGVLYFQKGKAVAQKGENAKDWQMKALDATSKSIQREPHNAFGYHKRSLVYQELQDYGSALKDIQQALKLDRKEPEYYMLQSWFLANLGQASQARNSLDTYLLYKPGEGNSDDVVQIKNLLNKSGSGKS
jgi:tetratricopeptide (TPR) repeat protein